MSAVSDSSGFEHLSDERLIEECRKGNGRAWSALVERYKRLVFSVPIKFRLSEEDAADMFQGVWMDLHSELDRLREPAAVRGWLLSVATHKCLHFREKEARRAGLALERDMQFEQPDFRPIASEVREEAEREQLIRDAVMTIPDRCRRMVQMLFYEHPPRPYAEVARLLGMAEGSIGFVRGRCLKKLKKALEKRGISD